MSPPFRSDLRRSAFLLRRPARVSAIVAIGSVSTNEIAARESFRMDRHRGISISEATTWDVDPTLSDAFADFEVRSSIEGGRSDHNIRVLAFPRFRSQGFPSLNIHLDACLSGPRADSRRRE
jgi:hypothetical protein